MDDVFEIFVKSGNIEILTEWNFWLKMYILKQMIR